MDGQPAVANGLAAHAGKRDGGDDGNDGDAEGVGPGKERIEEVVGGRLKEGDEIVAQHGPENVDIRDGDFPEGKVVSVVGVGAEPAVAGGSERGSDGCGGSVVGKLLVGEEGDEGKGG